jgi:hypothetical protein
LSPCRRCLWTVSPSRPDGAVARVRSRRQRASPTKGLSARTNPPSTRKELRMRSKVLAVSTCVGAILAATTAGALLVPKKARQIKGEFVPSYTPCSTPTTTLSPPLALSGCRAYPSSDTCVFGPDASGKYRSVRRAASSMVRMTSSPAQGNGASGCDGNQLTLTIEHGV